MLLILRSTARSCASTAASPVLPGPSTAPVLPGRFAALFAAPVVEPDAPPEFAVPVLLVPGDPLAPLSPVEVLPPVPGVAPAELTVPAALVPGGEGDLLALPAPLGSLAELFRPAALPGPDGTPLID